MLDLSLLTLTPVFPDSQGAAANVCVFVRHKPDPVAGWFVPVRHTMDASVYLGALTDGRGRHREWLEIWVQSTGLHAGRRPPEAHLTNGSLDQRWLHWCEALIQESPEAIHAGPWQESHVRPIFFAPDQKCMVHPIEPKEDRPWLLCQDDFLLRKQGLATYSGTLHRFLVAQGGVKDPMFVNADPNAPGNARCREATQELGFDPSWVPFNPEGGLMLFKTLAPYSLREFKAVLEGRRFEGANQEVDHLVLPGLASSVRETGYLQNGHGFLFSGRRGRANRTLELFLLKTSLFAESVGRVADAVRLGGAPFLNLHANDFRVSLNAGNPRLPICWSFQAHLVRSAESLAVEIPGARNRLFQPLGPLHSSEYLPKQLSGIRSGQGSVRIRDVRIDPGDLLVAEGTLGDLDATRARRSDLLHLMLPVRGSRFPVYARILSDQQLAAGEVRFETLGQPNRSDLREALMAVEGAPLESVPFQFQPIASSPSDLYSCAILGLELLIDPTRVRTALALDEFLSLAKQVALEDAALPLSTRRAKVLNAESRFIKSLGPNNIGGDTAQMEESVEFIPGDLWWAYIECLLKMIPGELPDAWARDLGDVNPAALESCFKGAQEELFTLAERIRTVLFSDWTENREVVRILEQI